MAQPSEQDRPSAVLRTEHQIILRVLGVLQRLVERSQQGAAFERESLGKCVEFFRLFADACHHGKEEDWLFPVLEQRGIPREGGPIGVMLYEHRLGRELTAAMGAALEALDAGDADAAARFNDTAEAYIALLTNHIFKEDNVLFNMGDRVMTPDDQKTLCEQFCEVGCRAFGGKTRAELEHLADELEAQWPAHT